MLGTPLGGIVAKGSNGAGPEDSFAVAVTRCLKGIEERAHVDGFGVHGIPLSCGREQGCQGIEVSDLVLFEQVEQVLTVMHIEDLMMLDLKRLWRVLNVTTDHVIYTVTLT